jgi:hypothetical protein
MALTERAFLDFLAFLAFFDFFSALGLSPKSCASTGIETAEKTATTNKVIKFFIPHTPEQDACKVLPAGFLPVYQNGKSLLFHEDTRIMTSWSERRS